SCAHAPSMEAARTRARARTHARRTANPASATPATTGNGTGRQSRAATTTQAAREAAATSAFALPARTPESGSPSTRDSSHPNQRAEPFELRRADAGDVEQVVDRPEGIPPLAVLDDRAG